MNSFTYVVNTAQGGYLCYFLKMCMTENRTTEIRKSQGPGVIFDLELSFTICG